MVMLDSKVVIPIKTMLGYQSALLWGKLTLAVPSILTSSLGFRAPMPALGNVDCKQMIFPPLVHF